MFVGLRNQHIYVTFIGAIEDNLTDEGTSVYYSARQGAGHGLMVLAGMRKPMTRYNGGAGIAGGNR
jgi:hypothetical protein